MDILQITKQKLQKVNFETPSGINAVLIHIEIAEKRYRSAKESRDFSLYTDVIYRTNQAFEGILKEGYTILANKDGTKVTSNEIEKYLLSNHVFKERVMELFTNYRQNWRNPSTHNHQLFFSEEEAFLAIVTVSAFTYILIDQILEKLSYEAEKAHIEIRAKEIKNSLTNYYELGTAEKIRAVLGKLFLEICNDTKFIEWTEPQQRGLIAGFLSSIEPNVLIDFEPKTVNNSSTHPIDFLLHLHDEKIALLINRRKVDLLHDDLEFKPEILEIEKLLLMNKLSQAVIFYFPLYNTDEPLYSSHSGDDENVKILSVSPIRKEWAEEMAATAASMERKEDDDYKLGEEEPL